MSTARLILVIVSFTIAIYFIVRLFLKHKKVVRENKKLLKSPYARRLSLKGVTTENILELIDFKCLYENKNWLGTTNKSVTYIVGWKEILIHYCELYSKFRLRQHALDELELLFRRCLWGSVNQLYEVIDTKNEPITTDTLFNYWDNTFPWTNYIPNEISESKGFKIMSEIYYSAIFEKIQVVADSSLEVYKFFSDFTRPIIDKNFAYNVRDEWRKKLLHGPIYQNIFLKELKEFEEAGVINEKFIKYFRLNHPEESQARLRLTFDKVAFEELKKKLELERMSNLQAIPLAELAVAYNGFARALIN